jgi:GntR family transcriptional regulator/MocR family aminotransferase
MGKTTSSIELGFIRLNRRKRKSLATQLYQALSQAILDGQLAKGFRLPSTRGLAEDLGVSRTTVISAFEQLTAEGYLTGAVGKGTFVSEQLPEERQLAKFRPLHEKQTAIAQTKNREPTKQLATKPGRKLKLGQYAKALESANVQLPNHGDENLIPFLPGVPALDEFPVDVWARLVRRRWKAPNASGLSYGSPVGYAPLRSAIAEYVRAFRGVKCDEDQVFVVSGTQQAVDLIARLVIDKGDRVLFENPGYNGARSAFESEGATIVPVEIDGSGMNIDQAIEKSRGARMVYVTPSHQFPMSVTLSIERRMKLIDWAKKTGSLIFEDDYDSEYRYAHRPIPSLQGLGDGENTIYVGSFSKVIFPSLSMGYVIVPKSMTNIVARSLSLSSRPASTMDQMILTDFIAEGHFARHLRRMKQIHQQRRIALVESVETHLSDHLEIVGCEAGLHCAALLKNHLDDRDICERLDDIGVVARPLSNYFVEGKTDKPGLLLGFASATPARIRNAVKKMKSVFD